MEELNREKEKECERVGDPLTGSAQAEAKEAERAREEAWRGQEICSEKARRRAMRNERTSNIERT